MFKIKIPTTHSASALELRMKTQVNFHQQGLRCFFWSYVQFWSLKSLICRFNFCTKNFSSKKINKNFVDGGPQKSFEACIGILSGYLDEPNNSSWLIFQNNWRYRDRF